MEGIATGKNRGSIILLDSKVVLNIGPKEMTDLSKSFFSKMEEKSAGAEILFPNNPTFTKWLKEQPHLLDHTTFQFYFLNKISMSANGRFIGIKYDEVKEIEKLKKELSNPDLTKSCEKKAKLKHWIGVLEKS